MQRRAWHHSVCLCLGSDWHSLFHVRAQPHIQRSRRSVCAHCDGPVIPLGIYKYARRHWKTLAFPGKPRYTFWRIHRRMLDYEVDFTWPAGLPFNARANSTPFYPRGTAGARSPRMPLGRPHHLVLTYGPAGCASSTECRVGSSIDPRP